MNLVNVALVLLALAVFTLSAPPRSWRDYLAGMLATVVIVIVLIAWIGSGR